MENNDNLHEMLKDTKIIEIEATEELKKSFISYAMAVNVSRAIPDVRDGLKPVHRRILFTMGELNNYADKPHKKCARIVGDCMGKYHPHGDSSVYDAMVRFAQDFSIRYPLIDGHGNFGSVDGDSPAAMRYTEARLSKIAACMLTDIDCETVDFYPNFDETLMQPRVLPAKFPNLLVNGADGIAVGMATNIPPHNMTEVINGVQALIKNRDIEIDELISYIPAPDFPTGGIIMGTSGIINAYRTGKGNIVLRGRAEIEEKENGRQRIIITELPYHVNKARFIIQMADLVKNKKIEGISDIREESDREGMRVVVEIKRDGNAQVVLNLLYKKTMLQQGDGINFLSLVKGEPKVCNLKQMLEYYLEHQIEVVRRKTMFDLRKAQERMHIVKGLLVALENIDEVIKIIKNSKDKDAARADLTSRYMLDDIQANAILDMKLSRLTGLEVNKLMEEHRELEERIVELQSILENESKVLAIINDDLEKIKQTYGDKRRTEISHIEGDINLADLIKREDVVISSTHQGYIKRMSCDEYRAQRRGGVGVNAHKTKEEDFVSNIFVTNTHTNLFFFSNFGRVYKLFAYEIPEAQRQAKGRAMINLLPLSNGEKINAIIPVLDDASGFIVMATKGGLIKKTPIKEFESIRKNGKIAINLVDGDTLIDVGICSNEDEILVAASSGRCARFEANSLRASGRTSMGVKSITLEEAGKVIAMIVVKAGDEQSEIVTVTSNGFGKRNKVCDFRLTKRGAKGVKAGTFNEKTGALVGLKQVTANDDIIMIADSGVIIRTPLVTINLIGRAGQGVKVMKLKNNAKVVSIAISAKEEEKEESVEAEIEGQNAQSQDSVEADNNTSFKTENFVEQENQEEE